MDERKPYLSDLTNAEWAILEPLIPQKTEISLANCRISLVIRETTLRMLIFLHGIFRIKLCLYT